MVVGQGFISQCILKVLYFLNVVGPDGPVGIFL